MKKLISVLICAVLVLGIMPFGAIAELPFSVSASALDYSCGENLTWSFDQASGTFTVSGTGAMYDYKMEIVDDITVGNAPWFGFAPLIKKIVISNGVTRIGMIAFPGCTDLTEVQMADSVTSIGCYAFSGCTALSSITLSANLTEIESFAFSGCTALASAALPAKLSKIGMFAFAGSGLKSVTVPEAVTEIGYSAFIDCPSLETVNYKAKNADITACITDSQLYAMKLNKESLLKTSSDSIFSGSEKLKKAVFGNKVEVVPSNLFYGAENLSDVEFSDSIKEIRAYAFASCESLEKAELPANLEFIGLGAFRDSALGSVALPASLKEIGTASFINCANLDTIEFNSASCNVSLGYYDNDVEKSLLDENQTAEEFKEKLVSQALFGPFAGAPVSEIMLGSNVKSISPLMFYGLKVNVPEGIEKIGLGSFAENRSGSITIPESVTEIGAEAFTASENLEIVYFNAVNCKTTDGITDAQAELLGIADKIKDIDPASSPIFFECDSLEAVIFGNNVVNVPANLFRGVTDLNTVAIPSNVKSIGDNCFSGCTGITTVYFDGTQEQWDQISIGTGNTALTGAEIIFPSSHTHEYHAVVTKNPTCDKNGVITYTCSCGDTYSEVLLAKGHSFGKWTVSKSATCVVDGSRYRICSVCSSIETEVIKATGHIAGEWQTVQEATASHSGKRAILCTKCGTALEEEIIPQLNSGSAEDTDTGIVLIYPDVYDGETEFDAEKVTGGSAYTLVDQSSGISDFSLYDLDFFVDGVKPSDGSVLTVKIPVPAGYDPLLTSVYRVVPARGKVEKLNAQYSNGFMIFDTDKLGIFALAQDAKQVLRIRNYEKYNNKSLKYRSTITFYAEVDPGTRVEWVVNGTVVTTNPDGSYTVKEAKEDFTIYCRAMGITSDLEVIKIKHGFFDRLAAFFQNLFRRLPVLVQAIMPGK